MTRNQFELILYSQSYKTLAKKGVFGSVLIKERRYWPKVVNEDIIKAYFEESVVGHTDCFRTNLLEDNSGIDIYGFTEPDSIMMLMATYGNIERVGQEQSWAWKFENANAGLPSNTLNLYTITSSIAMLLMIITIQGKLQSALKGLGLQTGDLIGSLHS